MDNNQDKSRLENLKKGLYSKRTNFLSGRSKLSRKQYDVKTNWKDETPTENLDMTKKNQNKKTFLEKMLLVAIIFFIVSFGVVALTIFGGVNKVSTENVDISAVGPSSVKSGGELSLQVVVTNNNATDLELSDLIIKYPAGTHSASEKNDELTSVRESLNTISSGKSVRKEFKSILYGEENSEKEIIISLEYRIAESNAIFFKDKKFNIKISSSPVNININSINEIISGQEIELFASVNSNAEKEINDLLLKVDYPFGFEFKESDPKTVYGNNIWEINNLQPGKEKIIKIKGIITGQNEEEKIFKFNSGTKSLKNENLIGAVYASVIKSLVVKRPFIGVEVAINGDKTSEYVSKSGNSVRVDVAWFNNSSSKIIDAEVKVALKGNVLNKSSVSADKGFYRSIDNTIIWNKTTSGELSEISPGESGNLSFSFSPLGTASLGSFVDPEISIVVSAKGNRISENSILEKIDSSVSRIVKISSDLMVIPRATYYTGPFVNSGAIPPKVDKETTYTITWTITNTTSNVSNVKVRSTLPAYVRWMSVVSPTSEKISYNEVGGEIIWDAGEIKAGTGVKSSPKEISFQVALLPSVSQVGSAPALTNNVTVTGNDRFTGKDLQTTKNGVSTRLTTDPGFNMIGSVVVE